VKNDVQFQPEISEHLKYQRIIRELKEENTHLRDEMTNLRRTIKSQQSDKKQVYIQIFIFFQKRNKYFSILVSMRRWYHIN